MSKSHVSTRRIAIAMFLFAFVPFVASAAPIYQDNFEPPTDVTVADGGAVGGAPAGWTFTGTGTVYGIQNPMSSNTYTGTTGLPGTIANMDGPQVVYNFAAPGTSSGVYTLSHTLPDTLALGMSYSANISVGHRGLQNSANPSLGYFFELLAGSTVIASASDPTGASLPGDSFTLVSISHTAIISDPIGQALTIRFGTNVPSPSIPMATDFDAVQVWAPEPASLSLLGLGSLAMLRRRRA